MIALDHLNLLPQLSLLLSRVLIPRAVRQDLFKRRATKDRLRALFNDHSFFERCNEYDPGTVAFLLAERTQQGMKDRAEVEAVVQASQVGATVIVDDRWGRELAFRADLDHHGTFWVMARLYELGPGSASLLRQQFQDLRQLGIRLPGKEVNELLNRIGEEPLANA